MIQYLAIHPANLTVAALAAVTLQYLRDLTELGRQFAL